MTLRTSLTAAFFVVLPQLADAAGTCGAGRTFASHHDFVRATYLEAAGLRCGTPHPASFPERLPESGGASQCTLSSTTIDPKWEPGPGHLVIPVVVHIITNTSGTGDLTNEMVQSQIDVLNEDFLATPGTPGAGGAFSGIRFELATEDPDGAPTTGITRTANNTWFADNDEEGFKTALNWDPNRYLNFYTNNTDYLGYAYFPQWGAGTWEDGVVVYYRSFGRPSPFFPYNLGRTATHEVGHWLGLLHTFQGSCGVATAPGCYTTGDVVCDTNPDSGQTFGCPAGATSCGGVPIPIENYMEYTDDACMERFTPEQVNRMRCSLINYRPAVYTVASLFADGFESGDLSEWSASEP